MGLLDNALLVCAIIVLGLCFCLIVLTLGLLVLCTKACIFEAAAKERFESRYEAMPRADGNTYAFDSIIEGDRTFDNRNICNGIGNSYGLRRTCDDNRCITAAVKPMFEYSNAAFEKAMKEWTGFFPSLESVKENAVTAAVAKGVLERPEDRIREYILNKLNNEPLLAMKEKEFEIANMRIITDLPAVQVTVEVIVYRPTLAQGKHLLLDLFMGPFEVSLQSGRVLGVVNMSQIDVAYD